MSFTSYGTKTITGYFDLTNGLVGTLGGDVDNAYMEYLGDGWYRCGLGFTADGADTAADFNIYCADADGDITVDRDGTSSLLLYGAQLEDTAFPTSYVPTTTAAVPRNADLLTYTASGNAGYPITYIMDWTPRTDSISSGYFFDVHDGTTNNRVSLLTNGATSVPRVFHAQGGANEWNSGASADAAILGVTQSVAVSYAANNGVFYIDGRSVNTDTASTAPAAPTTISIGMRSGDTGHQYAYINNVRIYPKVLNATEIKRLAQF